MRRLVPLLAVLAGLAGCGGSRLPDLFAVDRSGTIPGARLRIVVNDGGTVSCDNGPPLRMAGSDLIEARELQRDLAPLARRHLRLATRPGSVLAYDVRTPDGELRFADTSRPARAVFARLALLVRRLATEQCHLRR